MSEPRQITVPGEKTNERRLKQSGRTSGATIKLGADRSRVFNVWKARDEIEKEFRKRKIIGLETLKLYTHGFTRGFTTVILKTKGIRVFRITERILRQKANESADPLGKHNFNCSTGRIQRFRSNTVLSTISVSLNSVNSGLSKISYRSLLSRYFLLKL